MNKRFGSILLLFLLIGALFPALAEEVHAQELPLVATLFATPNPAVENLPVVFTAIAIGGKGPYQFEWFFDGVRRGKTASGVTTHSFTGVRQHTASVTITDSNGKTATSPTTTVEVKSFISEFVKIPPVATATAAPINGDAPLVVQFVGNGIAFKFNEQGSVVPGRIVRYEWNFGDGTVSNQQNPLKIYSRHGTFEATLTVVDENGNTDTDSIQIEVTEAGSRRKGFNFPPRMGEISNREIELGRFFSLQATAVDPENDPLTFSAIGLPDGFTITSKGLITGTPENKGRNSIIVIVEDNAGNRDFESFVLYVVEKNSLRGRDVQFDRISLTNGEYLNVGDILATAADIESNFDEDLDQVKLIVSVPELGLRRSSGPFDLDANRDELKKVFIEIPYDAPPGDYDIRITLNNDNFHRIIHRMFTIIE